MDWTGEVVLLNLLNCTLVVCVLTVILTVIYIICRKDVSRALVFIKTIVIRINRSIQCQRCENNLVGSRAGNPSKRCLHALTKLTNFLLCAGSG